MKPQPLRLSPLHSALRCASTLLLIQGCAAFLCTPAVVRTARPLERVGSPLTSHVRMGIFDEGGALAPIGRLFRGSKKEGKEEAGSLVSGLNAALKDAPLALKMAGEMLKPLVSVIDQAIADSQGDADDLISQARSALRADPEVTRVLGAGIEVGQIFSSMSSSTSVNGRSQRTVELQFYVSGNGISSQAVASARGVAEDGARMNLVQLRLDTGRGAFEVSTLGGPGSAAGADGIIDVEAE